MQKNWYDSIEIGLDDKQAHTFISRVENDGENITLKTLFDIVERGLGGKLKIEVQL